jgi:hypothetical protein
MDYSIATNANHITKYADRNIYERSMAYKFEWKNGYEDMSQKADTATYKDKKWTEK